jgi:hypothetical protein
MSASTSITVDLGEDLYAMLVEITAELNRHCSEPVGMDEMLRRCVLRSWQSRIGDRPAQPRCFLERVK